MATGGDALIRCQVESVWGNRRKLAWWNPQTQERFAADRETTPEHAQETYDRLTAAFRDDLYVTALTRPLPPPTTGPGRR